MEPDSPNGFPIAAIFSPTFSFDESPILIGCRYVLVGSTLTTAMSRSLSVPMTLPMYASPSRNVIITLSASCTTC